jgi:hypothetical protein
MTVTLKLNLSLNEVIHFDPASESWLKVVKAKSDRQRICAIPAPKDDQIVMPILRNGALQLITTAGEAAGSAGIKSGCFPTSETN